MKKVLSMLLVAVMLLTFAACGSEQDYNEDIRGDQIVESDENKDSQDAGEPSTQATEKPKFSLGQVNGLVYENKFAGIGCTFADGWTFYTDDQIKQLNNTTAELAGDDYKEMMEKADYFFDMYVTDSQQLNNVNVLFEKLNPAQLVALDFEEYYENSKASIKQNLENMGYVDVSLEIGTIEIDGEEFVAMYSKGKINGMPMYQVMFSKVCENYIVSATITTYNEDTTADIASDFYLL